MAPTNPPPFPQSSAGQNGMWHITPEQAAQASVVLIVYPDGVFGFTHHGVTEEEVGHVLRRVSDHILGGAIVEARTD